MAFTVFLILALGAVAFSANVVFGRNPAICAVHLVGAFFCLSGIYLLIGFPFLAAIQLMVYAGAIMVLFLFVIMLLDLRREEPGPRAMSTLLGPLFAAGIGGVLAVVLPRLAVSDRNAPVPGAGASASSGGRGMAESLFGTNLLAFEAASVFLLAGIVAVVVLAKRQRRAHREILLQARGRRPGTPTGGPSAPVAGVGGGAR
ncbi:MAG: NADH-quinone oxidoreductase subunit J [Planctomycetota bacterium]